MHCINFSVASLCARGCLPGAAVIKAAAYGNIDEVDDDARMKLTAIYGKRCFKSKQS